MSNQHDESEMVGAYLLDALDPEEREAFEAHLRGCESCRAELGELRQVVDVLPLACDQVEPSRDVRDRIMATVRSEAEERPVLTPLAGGRAQPRSRTGFQRASTLIAAVAAAFVVGLGLWNLKLQHDIDNKQHTIALYQADLAFQREVQNALAHGDRVSLMPKQPSPAGPAVAMVQPAGGGAASLIVRGLPATPANRVYEFWLIRGAVPHKAGLFTYHGLEPQVVHLSVSAAGYPVAAVTLERGPHGSLRPTSKPLLSGNLTA